LAAAGAALAEALSTALDADQGRLRPDQSWRVYSEKIPIQENSSCRLTEQGFFPDQVKSCLINLSAGHSVNSDVISGLEQLARQVRRQRRLSQLTQTELAGLAGVGLRFVSDLENAKPGLEIGRVLRVTQMLGLQLSVSPRVWPESE
jgi:HTH-type transcriptional regulator/antitoxin HipB